MTGRCIPSRCSSPLGRCSPRLPAAVVAVAVAGHTGCHSWRTCTGLPRIRSRWHRRRHTSLAAAAVRRCSLHRPCLRYSTLRRHEKESVIGSVKESANGRTRDIALSVGGPVVVWAASQSTGRRSRRGRRRRGRDHAAIAGAACGEGAIISFCAVIFCKNGVGRNGIMGPSCLSRRRTIAWGRLLCTCSPRLTCTQ